MMKKNLKSQISNLKFKDKRVLVIGLARSGVGAANLLSSIGAEVCVTDIKPRDTLGDNIKKLLPSVKVVAGGHPEEIFSTADLIVVSPGVPVDIPPLKRAEKRGIPIIGELELAYQVVKSEVRSQKSEDKKLRRWEDDEKKEVKKIRSFEDKKTQKTLHGATSQPLNFSTSELQDSKLKTPAFIAVTGTNGKSTTTTLVDLMLKESGFKTLLGGNIGNALSEEILKAVSSEQLTVNSKEKDFSLLTSHFSLDFIVAEVSSFQLESIKDFQPFAAVILNITPDHLNRYRGMEDYIKAKARIFENQDAENYLILNADDPEVMKLYNSRFIPNKSGQDSKFKDVNVLFFSREKEVTGIYLKDNSLHLNLLTTPGTAPSRLVGMWAVSPHLDLIKTDEIKIKGVHNLENAMAASLAAVICGCQPASVRKVLRDFPGLEHRLEFVREINGVGFVNDSKGTNVGAVMKSLESFHNIILIMGGRDKDGDFEVLKDLVKERVKTLILLGEAKDKITKAIGGMTETIIVKDIKEAVKVSITKASAGDVVLLSPGCASFDMFADFEDRGRKFKEAVETVRNDFR